ncbi:MAG TPA: DUF1634 domain-containing protein [Nevskiaceae bacterium]|nr:DUF1634 domain-containing protein [Nevskiaceae bacterium]
MSDAHYTQVNDDRLSHSIGLLLRVGVLISGTVVLVGAVLYLWHQGGAVADYRVFLPEPHTLANAGSFFAGVAALRGRDIIQLGLLLLIATPVLYVALAACAFLRSRDRLYSAVSLLVLAVLLFSLFYVR